MGKAAMSQYSKMKTGKAKLTEIYSLLLLSTPRIKKYLQIKICERKVHISIP